MYSNACEDYGSVNLLFDFDLSDPTFDYEVTIGMIGSSEVYNILDVVNFDSYVISSDYKSVTLDISNSATEDLCALVRLKLVDFDSGYNEAYDLNISVKRGSLTEFDNDLQPQNSNIPMEYYNVIDTDTDISDFYLFPPSGCTGFGSKGFYIKDNLNIDLDFCLEYSNNQNIPIQGNDNFVFGIGGSVTVKDGYTFTAENAYLALCPNLTGEWESIIIEDGATLIAENSTIKNAEKAVKVKDGGTVDLIDNTFTDNWTGIEIDKSVQIDQFDANIFESNIIGVEILRGQIIDLFPLDVTKPNQFIENNVGIQVKELCYNCIIKDNLFDENTYAAINGWQANFFAENNTIDDSPFGIKNNRDLGSLFKLNKIDGVDYGINLTRSFFGPDIINNEITAKNHGIYSLFVSGMEISGFNDILATAQVQTLENNGVGINIGRANKILNNFIDVANTKSAINLNGVRQATASGNVINLLTSNSTTGIGVDASYLQTHLDDNSITTTSSSESFGIKTDNSSDILSTCNTLTGVEDALRSDNNSMEVSFKGNTLSNFTRGVHLNHSSIGIQEHYGNIFSTTGTFGIDANNSDMSVEEQNGSIFWVDSDIDLDFSLTIRYLPRWLKMKMMEGLLSIVLKIILVIMALISSLTSVTLLRESRKTLKV